MTTAYKVEIDKAQMQDAIDAFEFVGGNTADAIRIAINKTLPKVRTLASKEIRSQVRLSAAYVRDRLVLRNATRSKMSGAITTPKFGNLLSRFDTDPTVASDKVNWIRPPLVPAGGIKFQVKPGGPTYTMDKETFYIVLNKGKNVAIAQRKTKARGPLDVFYGVSLSQVFNDVRGDITPAAGQEFQAQLVDAMRYVLTKRHPPEATA